VVDLVVVDVEVGLVGSLVEVVLTDSRVVEVLGATVGFGVIGFPSAVKTTPMTLEGPPYILKQWMIR
jgi:hypothetical protein